VLTLGQGSENARVEMKIQASEASELKAILGNVMTLLSWPGKHTASTSREYDK
jgi:hypothetical protein